jgi:pyruvate dehydrogenase E2 component (dihydrolipoamide acetyltransferase)
MDVRLPRLGEGADSGVIATVFVKEGDQIHKDQPVLEIESEKAVATIPAPAGGTVTKILVKEGDEIRVGSLILVLSENGAGAAAAVAAAAPVPPRAIDASVGDDVREEPVIDVPAAPPVLPPAARVSAGPSGFPVVHAAGAPPPASPSLRKIARELGIDLYRVAGSERGGRIVMSDLRAYVQKIQRSALEGRAPAASPAPPVALQSPKPAPVGIDFSQWGPVTKQKITTLRRSISRKMVESWTTVPHITQFDEVDVTELLALRKKYAPKYEAKKTHLTLTSFAIHAVVAALKKHPSFNASIDEAAGEIVFKDYFNIGIAVDTEQGLIVPVLRKADTKSVFQLSVELNEIAERTRGRKLSLEEMQGGTFTISNQGGIGSGHFTPIVNTPEVAILGMGRSLVKPVVREGKVLQRTMMPLVLSYDHRVNDGANAARFVVDLVKEFESIKEADVKI